MHFKIMSIVPDYYWDPKIPEERLPVRTSKISWKPKATNCIKKKEKEKRGGMFLEYKRILTIPIYKHFFLWTQPHR